MKSLSDFIELSKI